MTTTGPPPLQVGFLQGPLLLHVSSCPHIHTVHLTIALFQAYQHIFTSPSSASDHLMRTQSSNPQVGNATFPPFFAWIAMSLGNQLHMQQFKSVKPYIFIHCLLLMYFFRARFRTDQCTGVAWEEARCWLSLISFSIIVQLYH